MNFNLENRVKRKKLFNLFNNLSLKLSNIFNITNIEFEIDFKIGAFYIGMITRNQDKIKAFRKREPFETLDINGIELIEQRTIDYFKHYMPYAIKKLRTS